MKLQQFLSFQQPQHQPTEDGPGWDETPEGMGQMGLPSMAAQAPKGNNIDIERVKQRLLGTQEGMGQMGLPSMAAQVPKGI